MKVCEIFAGKSKLAGTSQYYSKEPDIPLTFIESLSMPDKTNKKAIGIIIFLAGVLVRLPWIIFNLFLINRKIKEHNPDVIINFYEPMAGLYKLLFRPKIPMICIGHTYLFNHPGFKVPEAHYSGRKLMKLYTWITSIGATKKLAASIYPLPDDKENSIYVIPPLLREETFNKPTSDEDYLLLYFSSRDYMDEVIQWHKKDPDVTMHCFVDDIEFSDYVSYDSTLYFHPAKDEKFYNMLANCKGLVSIPSFETISEAMYMDKPVYMVAGKGNYEEICISADAVKAGAGLYGRSFETDRFLACISNFKKDKSEFREWADQAYLIILKHIYGVLFANNNVKQMHKYPNSEKSIIYP